MFENNPICRMLGIKYPIFQGGMAWIGTAELASAVSNAGGLGLIGAGHMPPDALRNEIHKAKGWTDKPFGVNVMLMSPFVKEVMQVVLDERVPVITTGAGNPGEYVPALKEIGSKVIPVVASVALARRLVRTGVDAVIAEGTESGGHYKNAVLKAKDRSTVVTGRSLGHPARVLQNKLSRKYEEMEAAGASNEELEQLGVGSLHRATHEGDTDNGSVMIGEISGMLSDIKPVARIIEDIVNGLPGAFSAAQKTCE